MYPNSIYKTHIQLGLHYPRYLGGVEFRDKNADNRGVDNRGLTVLQNSWGY